QPRLRSAPECVNGNLAGVNWLASHRSDADVLILDASAAQSYAAKHIPGAMSVDLFGWYGLKEPTPAEMERLYQSWGINRGESVAGNRSSCTTRAEPSSRPGSFILSITTASPRTICSS